MDARESRRPQGKHVPATFFIVGVNARSSPGLAAASRARGPRCRQSHLQPSQSGATDQPLIALELNATQRLFQALTSARCGSYGRPISAMTSLRRSSEVELRSPWPILGYLSVGVNIDPDDWQRPPADVIVQRILDRAPPPPIPRSGGQIILLHDAGGDRSQTVAALPRLIDKPCGRKATRSFRLRTRRLHARPSDACGAGRRGEGNLDRSVFLTLAGFGDFLKAILLPLITIGLARFVFLTVLCLRGRLARAPTFPAPTSSEVGQLVSVSSPPTTSQSDRPGDRANP